MASMPAARLKVFICHASEDKASARDLCKRLRNAGVQPWLDEDEILPGSDWDLEIQRALRDSDAVLVLLSANSTTKRGYLQREVRRVIDVAEEQPEGSIFVIPVRLEECDTPERLRRLQWVDYNHERGYERLVMALEARARFLGIEMSISGDRRSGLAVSEPILESSFAASIESPRPYSFERLGGQLIAACLHADGRHAWAGGEGGRILKSDDAGQSWERIVLDRSLPTVLSIRFPDDFEHGWSLVLDNVSSAIYATENGGRAWEEVARFQRIVVGDFLMHEDGQRGWAFAVDGDVLVTLDGWQTWHREGQSFLSELLRESPWHNDAVIGDHGAYLQTSPQNKGFDLADWLPVHGLLTRRVAFLGKKALALSTQGRSFTVRVWDGEAWDSLNLPEDILREARVWSEPHFDVALGPSFACFYILLSHGVLLESVDGGATWTGQRPSGERNLSAMAFQPAGSSRMLVGAGELILLSTDQGGTWTRVHDPLDGPIGHLLDVSTDSTGRNAWILADGGCLLRTQDSGHAWRRTQLEWEPTHIVFRPDGYAGCAFGGVGRGMHRTRDGGHSWTEVDLAGERQETISRVIFDASGKRGWASGRSYGSFFFTDDGGESWKRGCARTYPGSHEDFPAIALQPDWERVWFGGYDIENNESLVTRACYSVFPYSDFPSVEIPVAPPLSDLWFSRDGRMGFALSNTGLARSTNGGETWEACQLPVEFEMANGFWFDRDGRNGWIYGLTKPPTPKNYEQSGLLRTADGGETWFPAPLDKGTQVEYLGLAFSDDFSRGWLVGACGFLFSASLPDYAPLIHHFAISITAGTFELRVEAPGIERDQIIADIRVSGPGLDFVQDKMGRRFRLSEQKRVPGWSPTSFLPGQSYRFKLCVSNGWNIASKELVLRS